MNRKLTLWEKICFWFNGGYVYVGEKEGLRYYKFLCPYCLKIGVNYNHGRSDKLRVTCPSCGEQIRYGYLWIDREIIG